MEEKNEELNEESKKTAEIPAETGGSGQDPVASEESISESVQSESTGAAEGGAGNDEQDARAEQQGDKSIESDVVKEDESNRADTDSSKADGQDPNGPETGAAENTLGSGSEESKASGDGSSDGVQSDERLNHLDGNEEAYGKLLVSKLVEAQVRTNKDVFRIAPRDYDVLVMNRLLNGTNNTIIDHPRLTVVVDSEITYGLYIVNE